MKTGVEYVDAPEDVRESLDRAVLVRNFELTPEGVQEFVESRTKKSVNIYLSVDAIEHFKN